MPLEINFFNPRSVILFICILQGVVFASLLFARSRKRRDISDFWLGMLLLVMCTSLITHFIGFANVYDNNQFLTFFPFELVFGHAPIVYLYVLSVTDAKRRLRKGDLLLFIPALINWVFYFILFLQDMSFKDWYRDTFYHQTISIVGVSGLFIWNAVLLYLSITHYLKYRKWLDDNYADTEKIKFDWLRNFLYIFVAVFLLEAVFGLVGMVAGLTYIQAFYLKLVFALVTYYLAIAGFLRSRSIKPEFSDQETSREVFDPNEESKSRLASLMEEERPFLQPDITLSGLARMMGINTSRLSATINKGFGKNFNDFINEYRIESVKEAIINDPEQTLLEIAFESGFNSKATFNRSFKKFTGQSPGEFARSNKDS